MVLTADCPTLCLYAPAAGVGGPAIAVIHAGWRGIVAGVVEAGFVALGAADPGAIRCFLGPCAGPCCYEVGPEVASRFPVGALRVRPGGEGGGSPRVQLDLAAAIWDRLAAAVGLPLVLEAVAPGCTICDRGEQWFSHRRSRTSARQGLIAALRPRIP
jgi:hypothetical protein